MFIDGELQRREDEILGRHAVGLRFLAGHPHERPLVPFDRALVGWALESHAGADRAGLAERAQRRISRLHFPQQAIAQHTVGVPAVVRHDHEIRPQPARKPQVPGRLRIRLAGGEQDAPVGTGPQQVFAQLFEDGRQPQPLGEAVPGERCRGASGRLPVHVGPFAERVDTVHPRRVRRPRSGAPARGSLEGPLRCIDCRVRPHRIDRHRFPMGVIVGGPLQVGTSELEPRRSVGRISVDARPQILLWALQYEQGDSLKEECCHASWAGFWRASSRASAAPRSGAAAYRADQ